MSDYDNDPRVERVNGGLYAVQADDGKSFAFADSPSLWWTEPQDAQMPAAMSRDDANDWADSLQRGPFPSAGDAIRSLIGDPR